MNRYFYYIVILATLSFFSCKKDMKTPVLQTVNILLSYPSTSTFSAEQGVKVQLINSGGTYASTTDANGKATFAVPVGIYNASVTDTRSLDARNYIFNGLKTGVAISSSWDASKNVELALTVSQTSQIVIKEIYVGGVPKDNGSGTFAFDKYITLYNNSNTVATLSNACIGMVAPNNSQATNTYYDTNGKLRYESEGWIPATQGFWYFQSDVSIDPGKQLVIALNNAVDNTLTYSKSINFANKDYYATYDMTIYTNTSYYVPPSSLIPTSHYLKAIAYAAGNAWALSTTSPGVFLFTTDSTTPAAFAADPNNIDAGSTSTRKVKVGWVLDGVETFLMNNTSNRKRFTSDIDAGYVYHLNNYGYSIYRNVDKTATEALSDNAGKLVYNYSLGTVSIGGTTDPSGIDTEASIKNGAHIIYQDTNNSTNDFHLRSMASLRN
ncbi:MULTISPECIES: DUF4876 domain-containing protein [Chitinophagaceae]